MTLPTAAASTTRRKFCGICPAIVFPWFVWFPCRNSLCIERFLEFEADPRGSGEGGGVEEAAGWTSEPVVHAGPEGAEVAVEALGEAIVGEQREGVLAAAAAAAAVIGAAGVGAGREAVLLVAVVGGHQVHLRAGCVLHPRPVHLQGLLVVVGGGVDDGEHIAADGERAGSERGVGIGELDVLVAGKQRWLPEAERPHHRVSCVVGDSGPEGVTGGEALHVGAGGAGIGQVLHLRGSERGGGDGVVLLGVVEIARAAAAFKPELQLVGGVGGSAGA